MTPYPRPFALVLLGIGGLLISASPAAGQAPYAVLHAFTQPGTNPPRDPLVEVGNGTFYGTTTSGGIHGGGTIFRINSAGVLTTIQHFDCGSTASCAPTGLILARDGFLYGMTANGGAAGQGSIFRIDGGGSLSTLHSFNCANGEGCRPSAPLLQAADGFLYGSASRVMFRTSTAGAFTSFHTEPCGPSPLCGEPSALIQASDGFLYGTTPGQTDLTDPSGSVFRMDAAGNITRLASFPCGSLGFDPCGPHGVVQGSDGFFYGVTGGGGTARAGTAFRMDAAGSVVILRSFSCDSAEGCGPLGLVLAGDGFFYGTTNSGPPNAPFGGGTVFVMDSSGDLNTLFSSFDCDGPDGCAPGRLMQAKDGRLYGTTGRGAAHDDGTVFRITTAGDFKTIHKFGSTPTGTHPNPGLVQAPGGTIYGTASDGGSTGWGTVFGIDPSGAAAALHSFDCASDGCQPRAGVVLASDGALYGTTSRGGATDGGTVFKVTTAGVFTVLHEFVCGFSASDGCRPYGGLIQASDGNLYGTTVSGGTDSPGSGGNGTVFRIAPEGVLGVLHSFDCHSGACRPVDGLIQGTDGRLYGIAPKFGSVLGSVYAIDTAGTFTPIHVFDLDCPIGDACEPAGLLLEAGGTLAFYGASKSGGTRNEGTFYNKVVNGPLNVVHSFDCTVEGCRPEGGLMLPGDGNFYGTTTDGGALGGGSVYRWDGASPVTVAHFFACATDGCHPRGTLLQGKDGDLYGTAQEGPRGGGVVFELGTTHPGEASPGGDMAVSPNVGTSLTLSYTPACGATTHAIYWGTSPIAGSLAWTNAACGVGSSGIGGFDPGTPPVGRFFYFVIVGQSGVEEGSYGRDSAGQERPEAQGVGACDRPRSVALVCP